MPLEAESLTLELEEPYDTVPAMRQAIQTAHWFRKHSTDGSGTPDELNAHYQAYSKYGLERFQAVANQCARMATANFHKRRQDWYARQTAYLDRLGAKNLSSAVINQRYAAWQRRNPRPLNFYETYTWNLRICGECQNAVFAARMVSVLDMRNEVRVCRPCRERVYGYCGDCGVWYRKAEGHFHPRSGSECIAPMEHFRMPNVLLQAGYQPSDRVITVRNPSTALVPASAISAIAQNVRYAAPYTNLRYITSDDIRGLLSQDLHWETKDGKLSKRLANRIYKQYGTKLGTEYVTKIGNIAKQAISQMAELHVEFTRKLDGPAANFHNGDSCWWGSVPSPTNRNRCILKQNGGMAMRMFSGDDYSYNYRQRLDNLSARAWVIPLSNFHSGVQDPMNAHAFLLFNAYGDGAFQDTPGQQMAAILASLLGWEHVTVIRDDFECQGMYLNSGSAYLITKQAVSNVPNIRMVIDLGNVNCSCKTGKSDRKVKYPYNDDDWTAVQIEEKKNDDRTGGVVVSGTERPQDRVFDDDDVEPDDDADRVAREADEFLARNAAIGPRDLDPAARERARQWVQRVQAPWVGANNNAEFVINVNAVFNDNAREVGRDDGL